MNWQGLDLLDLDARHPQKATAIWTLKLLDLTYAHLLMPVKFTQ